MTEREFYEVTSELAGLYHGDLDTACEHCPYCDRCAHEELYWGCDVWEESMGEDL
jgi:hypothetical protein